MEYHFQILQAQWDYYVLASALLYFGVAYRFDNRLVLSLAIATLGTWFVGYAPVLFLRGRPLRLAALGYGFIVAALGVWLYDAGIKRHFLETYLHVGANMLLAALLSGIGRRRHRIALDVRPGGRRRCDGRRGSALSEVCVRGLRRALRLRRYRA